MQFIISEPPLFKSDTHNSSNVKIKGAENHKSIVNKHAMIWKKRTIDAKPIYLVAHRTKKENKKYVWLSMKICLFTLPSREWAHSHIQRGGSTNAEIVLHWHIESNQNPLVNILQENYLNRLDQYMRFIHSPSEINKNQVIVYSSWTYWLPNFCSNISMLFYAVCFFLFFSSVCGGAILNVLCTSSWKHIWWIAVIYEVNVARIKRIKWIKCWKYSTNEIVFGK